METQPAADSRRALFHFADGTRLALEFPRQLPEGSRDLVQALREAITADQLAIEAEGRLLVIQAKNLKYLELVPAPEKLPAETIRHARFIE